MNFMLLVARATSHSFAALTREILLLPLEHKIHIFSPPCNILYITNVSRDLMKVVQTTRKIFGKSGKIGKIGEKCSVSCSPKLYKKIKFVSPTNESNSIFM